MAGEVPRAYALPDQRLSHGEILTDLVELVAHRDGDEFAVEEVSHQVLRHRRGRRARGPGTTVVRRGADVSAESWIAFGAISGGLLVLAVVAARWRR